MKREYKLRKLYLYLNKKIPVKVPPRKPVVEVLIRTILSQNTSDKNRDIAYEQLVSTFGIWIEIMRAPIRRIESAIRPAGLPKAKARAVKEVLSRIYSRWGRFEVDKDVCSMSRDEFFGFFGVVKGIGIKTMSVVLAFSCKKPVFPVDTHIFRISRRLGLVSANTSREKAYETLNQLVPDEWKLTLHLQMIEFGKEICKPSPLCEDCGLTAFCDYYTTIHSGI